MKLPITTVLVLSAALSAPAAPKTLPDGIRAFAEQVPRITAQLQDYVATERMTQMVMDGRADRVARKQVLVSDYQIAPLEEDPSVLWEFRFVRSIDGKTVPGADRQIEDFFRLRHKDAAEERLSIAQLGVSKSLPGCYWHNLTLVLQAFGGANAENFDWKGDGDRYSFEQVRGLGIPEDIFDPQSPRHYPKGSLVFSGGTLSRVEMEWSSRELITVVALDFSPAGEAGGLPRPSRYVAKRRLLAGMTQKTLVETVFEYKDYRHFSVSTEPKV